MYPLIILQLKSAYNPTDLLDIEEIYSYIGKKYAFKIRGHEIHQSLEDLRKMSLIQRARLVTKFCTKNEIEYLTLHIPTPRNEQHAIHSEISHEKANDLILGTAKEAEMIYDEGGFKNKVVLVYHLPSVISIEEIYHFDREMKFRILEKAEKHLIDFCQQYREYLTSFAILTLENVFPKYFLQNMDAEGYATVNMFHPAEMIRLKGYGVKTTLDLSHYNIYSNFLSSETDDNIIRIERQVYGSTAPSWHGCIDLISDSLVQLHISNSMGTGVAGEGLELSEGEIPLIEVLKHIRLRFGKGPVRATIELKDGHENHSKLQRKAVEWLLLNASSIIG